MSWLRSLFWMLAVLKAGSRHVATSSTPNPECRNFKLIKDEDRSVSYNSKPAHYKCDKNLFKENIWYRFVWPSGSRMATSPPQTYRCGGRSSGWVKDAHPTRLNQRKTVTVCFTWHPVASNKCFWSQKIKVTKCNGFFVYQLKPAPNCDLRYCGNGKKETMALVTRVVHPTRSLLTSTTTAVSTISCEGAANCPLVTKTTWQSVKESHLMTATPAVTTHDTVSIKVLSIIAASIAIFVVLLIAIFSCITIRVIKRKRKRCENVLRPNRSKENTDEEIVLDATVVYASTDKYGYLIPVDGKKESFYQGLKPTRESFYHPLKPNKNQNDPRRKSCDDDTENSDPNKGQRHRQVGRDKTEASSPLWINDENFHPHTTQPEEHVYHNNLDQKPLKNNLLKKKSNLSLCTEKRNSLFTDIEEKENLMPVARRIKEKIICDPKEYDNIKDYDRKENSKLSADRSSMKSEQDLTHQNASDEYSQQEPMYYVLEKPNVTSNEYSI